MRLFVACGLVIGTLASLHAQAGASETLSFAAEWRLVNAGRVNMKWQADAGGYKGQLHVYSSGLVSRLFKVNDIYDAQGTHDFCAQHVHLQAEEGSRKRDTVVQWNGRKSKYLEKDLIKNEIVLEKELDVPPCVHDVMAALHQLRRKVDAKPGQTFTVPLSDGKKFVQARVDVQEKERITTPAGTFQTTRFEAFLFNDVLYKRHGRLFIWISDDPRRLPVQIQVRMRFHIGTVTLQLDKLEPAMLGGVSK